MTDHRTMPKTPEEEARWLALIRAITKHYFESTAADRRFAKLVRKAYKYKR